VGREQAIPESFLAKIFQSLVHAGLVVSRRGARGGFALARPSDQITVRQVIEAVDGPIALNGCVLYPESCERSSDCRMRNVWLCTQQGMTGALDGATFADLGATAEQASAAAQPLLQ
jgi:Rrf2 family protein